eukprot:scaffold1691_cov378-Prasinococcus_capsulatus_cf.AAC.7
MRPHTSPSSRTRAASSRSPANAKGGSARGTRSRKAAVPRAHHLQVGRARGAGPPRYPGRPPATATVLGIHATHSFDGLAYIRGEDDENPDDDPDAQLARDRREHGHCAGVTPSDAFLPRRAGGPRGAAGVGATAGADGRRAGAAPPLRGLPLRHACVLPRGTRTTAPSVQDEPCAQQASWGGCHRPSAGAPRWGGDGGRMRGTNARALRGAQEGDGRLTQEGEAPLGAVRVQAESGPKEADPRVLRMEVQSGAAAPRALVVQAYSVESAGAWRRVLALFVAPPLQVGQPPARARALCVVRGANSSAARCNRPADGAAARGRPRRSASRG